MLGLGARRARPWACARPSSSPFPRAGTRSCYPPKRHSVAGCRIDTFALLSHATWALRYPRDPCLETCRRDHFRNGPFGLVSGRRGSASPLGARRYASGDGRRPSGHRLRDRDPAGLRGRRPGRVRRRPGPGAPGPAAVRPRGLPVHVPGPAVDHAAVRGDGVGRRHQPQIPVPPRSRPDRAVRGVRPPHPDGLRLRPSPGRGRGGADRGGHRLHRRPAAAVRRDPAGPGVHVHDHQRHGRDPAAAVRAAGGGKGGGPGAARGHRPE